MNLVKILIFFLLSTLLFLSCTEVSEKSAKENYSNKSESNDSVPIEEPESESESEPNINLTLLKEKNDKRVFQKVINLKDLQNTDFAITLENKLSDSKNVIYASSLVFAWDKLNKILKSPLILDSSCSNDFKLLYKSDSYKGSLHKYEYQAEAIVRNESIFIKAFYKKSLPFMMPFHTINKGVVFNNIRVKAFGIKSYELGLNQQIEILYYEDDNHFVLKLKPIYTEHEIFLIKGFSPKHSFSDLLNVMNKLIDIGKKEKKTRLNRCKYEIKTNDILTIPIINFNIETNYESMINQHFICNNRYYTIDSAYQRTAFILDEYGAEVESVALFPAEAPCKPKKLVFNKPFVIYLKRKDNKYPYFALKVVDTELMLPK
jgi:hypothetical protein